MHRFVTWLLMIAGFAALLLLNGKPFLNMLLFTGCMATAVVLNLYLRFSQKPKIRYELYLAFFACIVGLVGLYPSYQEQLRIEAAQAKARQNARTAAAS